MADYQEAQGISGYLMYLRGIKEYIKRVSEIEHNLDKYELIQNILFFINTLETSIKGWKAWIEKLPYNVLIYSDKEDLRSIYNFFKRITSEMVDMDLLITEKYFNEYARRYLEFKRKFGELRSGEGAEPRII